MAVFGGSGRLLATCCRSVRSVGGASLALHTGCTELEDTRRARVRLGIDFSSCINVSPEHRCIYS